jgi:hypothetical protein
MERNRRVLQNTVISLPFQQLPGCEEERYSVGSFKSLWSLRITVFLDFIHRSEFYTLKTATFPKLHLFPSSGEGRESHILCWAPYKELTTRPVTKVFRTKIIYQFPVSHIRSVYPVHICCNVNCNKPLNFVALARKITDINTGWRKIMYTNGKRQE